MHFITIVASERRQGNCDLLGRLAVRCALKSGADSGELVYLKHFDLKQCRGCLNCIFKKQTCKVDDDLYRILDIIVEADALLLIAPVYVLSIPGKLKLLLDRFLAMSNYLKINYGRPATSIGIAALSEWYQFQLPLMNLFLLALGRHVVDSYVLYGAGPGEVLVNDSIEKVQETIKQLIDYQTRPYESQVSKSCPVDFCDLFERIDGDNYRCPVCLTPAKATKDGFYFDAKNLNNHRWMQKKIEEHFVNWILQTRPRFKSRLKDIMKKKRDLNL